MHDPLTSIEVFVRPLLPILVVVAPAVQLSLMRVIKIDPDNQQQHVIPRNWAGRQWVWGLSEYRRE